MKNSHCGALLRPPAPRRSEVSDFSLRIWPGVPVRFHPAIEIQIHRSCAGERVLERLPIYRSPIQVAGWSRPASRGVQDRKSVLTAWKRTTSSCVEASLSGRLQGPVSRKTFRFCLRKPELANVRTAYPRDRPIFFLSPWRRLNAEHRAEVGILSLISPP